MAKAKEKKAKREKPARKQRRAMNKTFSGGDPENLDSQLKNIGLCTKNIAGDGNCLFRSLSDQYHGDDGNHKAIRQEVCQYLRENEETYKFFVEDDQSFEHHVKCMSQDATFGGNMELAAFAKLKKVDIKVYQPGMIYIINGVDDESEQEELEQKEQRHILHIAYHSWEHYSSIRNMDGPYSGPPEIKAIEQPLNDENDTNKDESQANNEKKEEEGLNSKEKVVRSAYPDASIRKIRRLLIKHKGNPDKVIDAIYESEHKTQVHNGTEVTKVADYEVAADNPAETDVDTIVKAMLSKNILEEDISTEKEDTIVTDNDSGLKVMAKDEILDDRAPTEEEDEEATHHQQRQLAATVNKKPKKLSAAERKKEQKKRQKEHKLMKDRAKAARKAGYKQEGEESDISKAVVVCPTQSMKEMYI